MVLRPFAQRNNNLNRREQSAGTHGNMGGSLQRCALLAGAVCAFVICVIGSRSSTNVAGTDELYLDDMKLAWKESKTIASIRVVVYKILNEWKTETGEKFKIQA